MRLCDKLMYTRVFRSLFAACLDISHYRKLCGRRPHGLGMNQETGKYFDIDYFKLSAPDLAFID
jgi:hypothetical protein